MTNPQEPVEGSRTLAAYMTVIQDRRRVQWLAGGGGGVCASAAKDYLVPARRCQ